MPRPTRAQKDKKKAKEEALKASEAINNGNTISTSNSASCGTSSHLVSTGGEARVLTAGESKQENVTKSNASEVVQDKRPEKSTAEIGKERSDGGERGPGENKHRKVIEVHFTVVQNKRAQKSRAEKSTAEIANERSGGGERGPGENKHQKVIEVNASATVQDKRADKSRAEIANARSGSGERGPSRKSSEEEKVSLQPSQLESRQKQRDDRPSFAGNKGFRQDFNGRNSSASQNYGGYNSRQGGQHGYYENRGSGRGGYNEGDNIDALGRALSGVLRHQAPELGLKVRSDGYVLVKDLLSLSKKTPAGLPLHAHSVDDLKEAVKRDNKQRFGLHEENGHLLIRANQGHSLQMIKSEALLKPVLSAEEVPVCIHGTYKKHLESIKKDGLSRMSRNHVHFAAGQSKEDGVISGMRGDCEVLVHLNVSKYLDDGMKLYRSENGVFLAEGSHGVVPPEYFDIEIRGNKRNNNI